MDDPEKIFAPGGALEAVIKARRTGKVRYIGFTGHKSPEIHLHMLDIAFKNNFIFDTVQMPLNVMDAHYDSFAKLVLPVLVQHDIAVLGMKPMGDQAILRSGVVNASECLRYAMSLPTSVVITGCDSMAILQQAINVARSFRPMTDEERTALLARTAPVTGNGEFEPYKNGSRDSKQRFLIDGTWHNPEVLGPMATYQAQRGFKMPFIRKSPIVRRPPKSRPRKNRDARAQTVNFFARSHPGGKVRQPRGARRP